MPNIVVMTDTGQHRYCEILEKSISELHGPFLVDCINVIDQQGGRIVAVNFIGPQNEEIFFTTGSTMDDIELCSVYTGDFPVVIKHHGSEDELIQALFPRTRERVTT